MEPLFRTRETGWVVLIRLLVGPAVFFPEGLQKLLFADILGAGRFAKIGIPHPDLMGLFVGVIETVCGLLIIVGLLTRLATIPLLIVMIVAVVSTKVPILLGHDVGPFRLFGLMSARSDSRPTSSAWASGARSTKRAPI